VSILQIVLFQGKNVLNVIDNVVDIKIEGNSITWQDGAIRDVKVDYLIVDDDVEIGPVIDDEIIALDKKAQYIFEKVDEVAELKAQLQGAREENEMNALAIMELAELVLGG
jgi:hypothetical protein